MCEAEFAGKVAIVTGGGSGIGEACVKAFAAGGAHVVVADLNEESGSTVAATAKRLAGDALFVKTDVGEPASIEAMVEATVTTFGGLDIAVNNAGIGGESNQLGDYSLDGWRRVIDINLNSVFYSMRFEIPEMLARGGGAIVNMSSILGSVGFRNSSAYVAAKHAVVGMTKSAALEYAQQGIRINSVGPGFIATPLVASSLDEAARSYLAGMHAQGRLGEASEVAEFVAFLCSQRASFMTGAYYLVDGGYTAQ